MQLSSSFAGALEQALTGVFAAARPEHHQLVGILLATVTIWVREGGLPLACARREQAGRWHTYGLVNFSERF